MKTKLLSMISILLLIVAVNNSFTQQEKLDIKLKQPPPNKLGVGDMWNLELNNKSRNDIKIYLTGTATEEKDGLIIEGKSKVFTLKPGRSNYKYNDFSNAEVKYNNGKYKEIVLRTGNAPEGSYTICVTAFNEQGEVVGLENCIMQNIILGIEKEIILLNPCETVRVDYNEPLIFTWMPLPDVRKYTFKLYEIKGEKVDENDTSYDFIKKDINENEILNSKPVYKRDEITGASFQLPASGYKFEEGKRYAWGIWADEVRSKLCWFYVPKQKIPKNDCRNFKVDIKRVYTKSKTDCCSYTLTITNSSSDPYSFSIFTREGSIISASNLSSNLSQNPSNFSTPQNNIAWTTNNSQPIGNGTFVISTICIQTKTYPAYLIYEWKDKNGIVICSGPIKIDCPPISCCDDFFKEVNKSSISNNIGVQSTVNFKLNKNVKKVTITVIEAVRTSSVCSEYNSIANILPNIHKIEIPGETPHYPFETEGWCTINDKDNIIIKHTINFRDGNLARRFCNFKVNFKVKYTFESDCKSCDTVLSFENLDAYSNLINGIDNNSISAAGNMNNSESMYRFIDRTWELHEHADVSIDALRSEGWRNWGAINKLATSNILTDIADQHPSLINLYCNTHPTICSEINCVKNYLQNCSFNHYPQDYEIVGSRGFHFDNCFSYEVITQRWNAIKEWVISEARKINFCNTNDWNKWLCLMGMVLHAVQDFYCHTNWVLQTSWYGANQSLNSYDLPTWEEFNDPNWLSARPNFVPLQWIMQISNSITSDKEIFIYNTQNYNTVIPFRSGEVLAGLQSGAWPLSVDIGWDHRHLGPWGIGSIVTQYTSLWRNNTVKIAYNNSQAHIDEGKAGMELSKRASQWWIKYLTSNEIINNCRSDFIKWVKSITDSTGIPPYRPDDFSDRGVPPVPPKDVLPDLSCLCETQDVVDLISVQSLGNNNYKFKFTLDIKNVTGFDLGILSIERFSRLKVKPIFSADLWIDHGYAIYSDQNTFRISEASNINLLHKIPIQQYIREINWKRLDNIPRDFNTNIEITLSLPTFSTVQNFSLPSDRFKIPDEKVIIDFKYKLKKDCVTGDCTRIKTYILKRLIDPELNNSPYILEFTVQ